jgi:Transglutaminase-like superfamily
VPLKYAFKALRRRALVAEALILLLVARLLIRFVPLRLWRSSLGRRHSTEPATVGVAWPSVRSVTRAINRAADRSPIAMVCLPRAMATQWMLGRRGVTARFVVGVAPSAGAGSIHALHAWVEINGRVIVGNHGERGYQAAFTLQQELASPKA